MLCLGSSASVYFGITGFHGGFASLLGSNSNLVREGTQCSEKSAIEKQIWAQNLTCELALGAGYLHFWALFF